MSLLVIALIGAADPVMTEAPRFAAGNEELRGYLIESGDNHPALKRRYAEWRAALARIPQATALDDPMLTYGQFLQSDMNRFRVGLAQKFPWFGTLSARGDAAARDADAALARFYAERNRVFAKVKQAYAEYAHLHARIKVTEWQTALLRYMEDVEESRFSLGATGQHDLLRVQIAEDRLDDRLRELRSFRAVISSELAEAVGRRPNGEMPWPQPCPLPGKPPAREEVLERVAEMNPDLDALDEAIAGRERNLALARKKGYPDFTLGFEGMARKRDADHLALSLSLNVPIWRGKVRASVAEAEYRMRSVEHERRDKGQELRIATERALFEFRDAERRNDLFRESLVPKAEQSYESLQSSYAVGTGNVRLIDLLDGANTLLELELQQRRAERDLHIAAAELEMLMGGPWTPLEDSGTAQ